MVTFSDLKISSSGQDLKALLDAVWVIYQIKFQPSGKILICHVCEGAVKGDIDDLLKKIQTHKDVALDFKITLYTSAGLELSILYQLPEEDKTWVKNAENLLLAEKYRLIKSLKAYMPYGLNDLNHFFKKASGIERRLAYDLRDAVVKELYPGAYAEELAELENKKHSWTGTTVYQYDKNTGEYLRKFCSFAEAAAYCGVNASNIILAAQGKIKTAGGYRWSTIKYPSMGPVEPTNRSRPVHQYNRTTLEYMASYNSCSEAARAVNSSSGAISSVCSNPKRTSAGYRWSWEKMPELIIPD